MIQKNIFFIWFGNNKANYVDWTANIFKEVNPTFNVEVIFEPDIEHTQDKLIQETKDEILKIYSDPNYKSGKCPKKFITVLHDSFRNKLIQKYGGICLDCDVFPIKPFDDKLLNLNAFHISRSFKNDEIIVPEYFMIGKDKDLPDNYKRKMLYPVSSPDKDALFLELKNKFLSCQLKYGDHYMDPQHCYIDHYNHHTWRADKPDCIVPNTIYDTHIF